MKRFTRIEVEQAGPVEFLFASDLESELHPGEDPSHGVHIASALEGMLKEARCEGEYSCLRPPLFIMSNGDEDSRFDKAYEGVWDELEHLGCPCYHVVGNHERGTFDGDGDRWKRYFGYEDTYYAIEYVVAHTSVTVIVLDTWCTVKDNGGLELHDGSGEQAFRLVQRQWLAQTLDGEPGIKVVIAHAHTWPPASRPQDNEDVDDLIDMLLGTYEEGVAHSRASVFLSGGHHHHGTECNRLDGVYFIDPAAGIHGAYARVVIDPFEGRLDYIGRLNERSYLGLDI